MHTHPTAVWWLGGLSALTFVATLVAIPWLVVRIPADYFSHQRREKTLWANRHPVIRAMLLVLKNLLGLTLVLAGVAMLVLPGQGLLTILIGMMLCNFPGKYRFEGWLISRPPVAKAVNWLRHKSGRPPIVPP